jgi:hypothetical protein
MRTLSADETAESIDNVIHLDTQRAEDGVDLTVAAVYKLGGGGRLDFGGSEYEEAEQMELRAERKEREDDYGWWRLTPGEYIIEYNERYVGDGVARVFPHARLLRAGASHSAFRPQSEESLKTLLQVGQGGIHIKENARVSTLVIEE